MENKVTIYFLLIYNNVSCRCDITDILLEMHRILRSKRAVIVRDQGDVILKVKNLKL